MPDEAARITGEAYVASSAFDVCKSPTTPVPYTIMASLANSIRTESTVRFTGNQAFHEMSRIAVVSGDEAGVGGGVKSQRNLGFCKPTEWVEYIRVNGNRVVMHDVKFQMNCMAPDSPVGNTEGKLFYVVCTSAASVTPSGSIVIDSESESGSESSSQSSDSSSNNSPNESSSSGESSSNETSTQESSQDSSPSSGGDSGSESGSEGSSEPSDSSSNDSPSQGSDDGASSSNETSSQESSQNSNPSSESGSDDDLGSLSEEQQKELDDLKRQEAEAEQEIEQLKEIAIEAGKALDPTPASDIYDLVQALQAGDIAGALIAAAFVLLSFSPWKLLKMGRGAFKLAKIMRKLSKAFDKLKAIRKKIAEAARRLAKDERGMIRISKPKPKAKAGGLKDHSKQRHGPNRKDKYKNGKKKKSYFDSDKDIDKVIKESDGHPSTTASNGNEVTVFESKEVTGTTFDPATGKEISTNTMTVVTDAQGNVITAYPGRPGFKP